MSWSVVLYASAIGLAGALSATAEELEGVGCESELCGEPVMPLDSNEATSVDEAKNELDEEAVSSKIQIGAYGPYGRLVEKKVMKIKVGGGTAGIPTKISRYLLDDGTQTMTINTLIDGYESMRIQRKEIPLICDIASEKEEYAEDETYSKLHMLTCGSEGLGTLRLSFREVGEGQAYLVGYEALSEMPTAWPKAPVVCELNCELVKKGDMRYVGKGTQACVGDCHDTAIGSIKFAYVRDGKGKLDMRWMSVNVEADSDDDDE